MVGITTIAIVALSVLAPNADHTRTITLLLGFAAPTTVSLLALMKAQQTHLSVNSRLDEFIKNASVASRAEGREEGRLLNRSEQKTDSHDA